MDESVVMYLPLPPAAQLLLAAGTLPARSSNPSVRVGHFVIRALSSSSPGFRKFLLSILKEMLDRKRIPNLIKLCRLRASPRLPLRVIFRPRATRSLRMLLRALLRRVTVEAVVVCVATLLALHVFRPRPVEDEDVMLRGRLPRFVRFGLEQLVGPRGPVPAFRLPPRTWTDYPLEALRFDERRRRYMDRIGRITMQDDKRRGDMDDASDPERRHASVQKDKQRLDMDDSNPPLQRRQNVAKAQEKMINKSDGLLKTEFAKSEATDDKFCKDKAAHIQNSKGKNEKVTERAPGKISDTMIKKMKDENHMDRSETTRKCLEKCLAALPRRNPKQGESSTSSKCFSSSGPAQA